jgi:serine/threonine protein kinase
LVSEQESAARLLGNVAIGISCVGSSFETSAGFTLDGTVKILDFGLARIVDKTSLDSNGVYAMSGETGSLRYMAPEVADAFPYNHKADVYSYGIVLWELNAGKKPFDGLNRELFYERVVHGGERPPMSKKWSEELKALLADCWSADIEVRPSFPDIVNKIDAMLKNEKSGGHTETVKKKVTNTVRRISGLIDRHSTWF